MASTTRENRKSKEKKSTEQEKAHFVSGVTVILTREKERDYLQWIPFVLRKTLFDFIKSCG